MIKVEFELEPLRRKILGTFGSFTNFSKAIGKKKQSLSRKLNGKTSIMIEDIVNWCPLLGIEVDEIGYYFFTVKSSQKVTE